MAKKREKEHSSYWRERAIEREALWDKKCRSTIEKELTEQYRKAAIAIQDDIAILYGRYASENGLTLKEAGALLTGNEFKEWRMSLEEYTTLSATDNAILKELNTLAMRPRISRLQKLHGEVLKELYKLGEATNKSMTTFLSDAYKDNYYKSLCEIGKTAGIQGAISAVDNKALENVLRNPWSGKNYSERIWTNQKRLADTLQETMSASIHRGLSVPKLSKMVQERMGVGQYEATRLVRTELNYVHNQANLESIKDSGMGFYRFVATLDKRTSQKCRAHDGMVIPVEDASPGDNIPPLHPHCRSTIIGSLGEGKGGSKGTRAARVGKGKTFYVPQQMKYEDFKAVYVDKSKAFADWAKDSGFKGLAAMYTPKVSSQSIGAGDIIDLKSRNFEDMQEYIGKLDNKAVREWYVYHDERIHEQISHSGSMEQMAKEAFDLRNLYRQQARMLMADIQERQRLEKERPSKSWEELIKDKMKRKKMTRQQAIEDIYKTAIKSNKKVNAKFGLGDKDE